MCRLFILIEHGGTEPEPCLLILIFIAILMVEGRGQGKVHSRSSCTNGGSSDEHAFWFSFSLTFWLWKDRRSCQRPGRGQVPVENRAPTADTAMTKTFDFHFHWHFDCERTAGAVKGQVVARCQLKTEHQRRIRRWTRLLIFIFIDILIVKGPQELSKAKSWPGAGWKPSTNGGYGDDQDFWFPFSLTFWLWKDSRSCR